MRPGEVREDDLYIPQGSTWRMMWPVTDGDGDPLPIGTGWTAEGQARRYKDSEEPLHSWSTQDDSILLEDGSLMLVVIADTSSAWDWREASYDVELKSPDGEPHRVLQGKVYVNREVTR